ncbi:hypothetical protein [Leptothoe sp. PORK10 BA2]|uniref:hypothetical protein n=1 Tax=Leptothoe sp. PORK10 BA2 TaxID=3110254 RepID=UPI002B21FA2D|nr:hypothetical protein [Leptothoe sp. PORK10 BA2]MEA5466103.1 hypothetical protein [Leptothoe sp. PORK10 BA2]
MLKSLGKKISSPILNKLSPGSIAMFHIGRSGSTVLGNLLNQNPNVFWDGEVYHTYVDWGGQKALKKGQNPSIDPVKLLQVQKIKARRRYYGFEVKFYHLDRTNISLPDYVQQISEQGISHFIILKRKNYLRKIVSSYVSFDKKKSRLRTIYESDHHPADTKAKLHQINLNVNSFTIDGSRKSLLDHLEYYQQSFQKLDTELVNKKVLRLTYEEHIAQGPINGYHQACDFLGISRHPVTVQYGKTNPFKLSEIVENFSEVEKTLNNTEFEWMLYE